MRMHRVITLAGLLLALSAAVLQMRTVNASSEEHASDRAAITKILEAQQSNWNKGDVDAFLEGYWHSPELTFSGSGRIARGWDGVLARDRKSVV